MSVRWREAMVDSDVTLRDVAHNLEDTGMQLCLLVEPDGRLVGTVSNGDVRSALLRCISLDTKALGIASTSPVVAREGMSDPEVRELMVLTKNAQIPRVDQDGILIGLVDWRQIFGEKPDLDCTMIIMAGGLGTRLYPLTKTLPKPMVEVAGKPILQHLIENATSQGIKKFMISINHFGDQIRNHFEDGVKFGAEIRYLEEDTPLGTAGALSMIPKDADDTLIVVNADVMTTARFKDLLSFHRRESCHITVAARMYELMNPYGVLKVNGRSLVGIVEKPINRSLVSAGIYVFDKDVLNLLHLSGPIDMPELLRAALRGEMEISVFPIHERWYDVGTITELNEFAKTVR